MTATGTRHFTPMRQIATRTTADLRQNSRTQAGQRPAWQAWLQYAHSCFGVPHVCSQRLSHIRRSRGKRGQAHSRGHPGRWRGADFPAGLHRRVHGLRLCRPRCAALAAPTQPATARALRVLFWVLGMPVHGLFRFMCDIERSAAKPACHGEPSAAILRSLRASR